MGNINLIPDDYRQDIGLRKLLRNFILACILTTAGVFSVKALLSYLIWRENVEVVKLEQMEQANEQTKTKTEEFRQKKQVTEQQLAALNALRGGDQVMLLLQAVDHAYSEGVWFDRLHFMRQSMDNTNEALPKNDTLGIVVLDDSQKAQGIELNNGVEIVGHALSHSILAEFMKKLGGAANVADLRLIDTGTRSYTTVEVVDFNLALQIKNKDPVKP